MTLDILLLPTNNREVKPKIERTREKWTDFQLKPHSTSPSMWKMCQMKFMSCNLRRIQTKIEASEEMESWGSGKGDEGRQHRATTKINQKHVGVDERRYEKLISLLLIPYWTFVLHQPNQTDSHFSLRSPIHFPTYTHRVIVFRQLVNRVVVDLTMKAQGESKSWRQQANDRFRSWYQFWRHNFQPSFFSRLIENKHCTLLNSLRSALRSQFSDISLSLPNTHNFLCFARHDELSTLSTRRFSYFTTCLALKVGAYFSGKKFIFHEVRLTEFITRIQIWMWIGKSIFHFCVWSFSVFLPTSEWKLIKTANEFA